MNTDEFKNNIEKAKKKYPIWFQLDIDNRATSKEIKEAEKVFELTFDNKYKDFLEIFGGGDFCFSNIFSLEPNSDWNVIRINKEINLLKKSFLAISDNEVGDYYGFKIENNICSENIYFYDHETTDVISTKYNDLYEFILEIALNGWKFK